MTETPVVPRPPRLPRYTERLVLRALRHGDEAAVLAYRRRADVCRYMPANPLDDVSVRAFIADRVDATKIAGDNDFIVLAVEHDDHVIGDVMVRTGQLADRQAEIGWVLNPDFQGQGFATEAARELIELALGELSMHRAWAQLDPRNVASARVCQRLGMRQEAHLRHDIWFKGEWGDTAIYAILADEWRDRG
jgi:RimJ/RimL family protein N-acetyltransferase